MARFVESLMMSKVMMMVLANFLRQQNSAGFVVIRYIHNNVLVGGQAYVLLLIWKKFVLKHFHFFSDLWGYVNALTLYKWNI